MTYSSNLFYGAPTKTLQKARELKKSMTPTERKLWEVLQNRQLDGYKFHGLPHPSPLLEEREFDFLDKNEIDPISLSTEKQAMLF